MERIRTTKNFRSDKSFRNSNQHETWIWRKSWGPKYCRINWKDKWWSSMYWPRQRSRLWNLRRAISSRWMERIWQKNYRQWRLLHRLLEGRYEKWMGYLRIPEWSIEATRIERYDIDLNRRGWMDWWWVQRISQICQQ